MLIKGRRVIWLLAALGVWQLGGGVWIHAKARLAQVLLERAWARVLDGEETARPWPWADTSPVARLRVPSRRLDLVVLQGDSGRSLAFGPGLAAGSAAPGETGTKLISAHRDTHFRPLEGIRAGERIELQTVHGTQSYRVDSSEILDIRNQGLVYDPQHDELLLVTCFPFTTPVPGGPLRYVVRAYPVGGFARQNDPALGARQGMSTGTRQRF